MERGVDGRKPVRSGGLDEKGGRKEVRVEERRVCGCKYRNGGRSMDDSDGQRKRRGDGGERR